MSAVRYLQTAYKELDSGVSILPISPEARFRIPKVLFARVMSNNKSMDLKQPPTRESRG